MLAGSINHVSLTVSDIPEAIRVLGPFLARLGYVVPRNPGEPPVVCLSRRTGGAVNFWRARPELRDHPFEIYETGLHHVAFNAESREQVDELHDLIVSLGGEILDPPAEWPFTSVGTYYAFYFRGPDGLKFECVWMSALEDLYRNAGIRDRELWIHEGG